MLGPTNKKYPVDSSKGCLHCIYFWRRAERRGSERGFLVVGGEGCAAGGRHAMPHSINCLTEAGAEENPECVQGNCAF